MARSTFSSIEALESRIAPAGLIVYHPLPDLVAGYGATSKTINLASTIDPSDAADQHTHVIFTTNFDTDPTKPGLQAGKIDIELYDDTAPLTVANFLAYVNAAPGKGYVGTYFQRAVNGFVLQGGGLEAAHPSTSIPTLPTVHNEYTQEAGGTNVTGTVAMAKVADTDGGGPNSATNQFFFNLADNSQNLDNQNGGFTVFGKVVSGMDVVQAIAALPKAAITSSDASTPVQNGYNADPDGNANTAAPLPKANQVVEITGAKVVAPTGTAPAGTKFSLVSVVDGSTGGASEFVTAKIVGSDLKLQYHNVVGANPSGGLATITVQVASADGKSSVLEHFNVSVLPNLIGSITSDGLASMIASGDTTNMTTTLFNTSGALAKGQVTINYYLSQITSTDTTGTMLTLGTGTSADDTFIGSVTQNVSIANGKSLAVSGTLVDPTTNQPMLIPTGLVDAGSYKIIAQIVTSDGINLDSKTDDNTVENGATHTYSSAAKAPDLVGVSVSDSHLQPVIVPGDVGLAKFTFGNIGASTADGKVDVKFYLSPFDLTTGTATLDTTKNPLVGEMDGISVNLATNKTQTVSVPYEVPTDLSLGEGVYRLYGVVSSSATGGTGDMVASDNSVGATSLAGIHDLANQFGTFIVLNTGIGNFERKDAVLTYEDSSHNLVHLKFTGQGAGQVLSDGSGGVSLQLEATNTSSHLTATITDLNGKALPNSTTTIVDISSGTASDTVMGNLDLGNVNVTGSVNMAFGVKTLTLGNITGAGDHTITIGTSTAKSAITLGDVSNTSFLATSAISKLSANDWTITDGTFQSVQAPEIDTFIAKNFQDDLTVTPTAATNAQVVKTMMIATLGVSTADQTMLLQGNPSGISTVSINGNVGNVTIGQMDNAHFVVDAATVPTDASGFSGAHSIAKLVVTGATDGTNVLPGMSNSQIAAPKINSVSVNDVAVGSGAGFSGITAEAITAYLRQDAAASVKLSKLTSTSPGVVNGETDVLTYMDAQMNTFVGYEVTLLDTAVVG